MLKNYKKIALAWACIFAIAFFILIPLNKIIASQLEVDYPVISGYKPDSNTQLPEYLKYIFNLGIFVGFTAAFGSLVWAGVLYLFSPVMPNAIQNAKDRVSGSISGILILSTLYLIITTINPDLAIFKKINLTPIDSPTIDDKTPAGIYFYNSDDCSENESEKKQSQIVSISDLGDLKNRTNSVKLVHDNESETYYISVLYDSINYSGMCKYINPVEGCHSHPEITPFADSASIYQYDFKPNGDGVYFYRKSFFNESGGVAKISNEDIKHQKIYIQKLEKITYNNDTSSRKSDGCTVPKEEQDCSKLDEKGNCIERECPNLSGKNITSIKIKGNYLVLLVYFDETKDENYGPWSYCQAFPTKDDVAKNGPNQIKWEDSRNNGPLPNYIVIIPTKQK